MFLEVWCRRGVTAPKVASVSILLAWGSRYFTSCIAWMTSLMIPPLHGWLSLQGDCSVIPTSRNLRTDEDPFREMRVRGVEAYLTRYFSHSLQCKRNQPMMNVLPNISISERISPSLEFDSISRMEEAQDEMKWKSRRLSAPSICRVARLNWQDESFQGGQGV